MEMPGDGVGGVMYVVVLNIVAHRIEAGLPWPAISVLNSGCHISEGIHMCVCTYAYVCLYVGIFISLFFVLCFEARAHVAQDGSSTPCVAKDDVKLTLLPLPPSAGTIAMSHHTLREGHLDVKMITGSIMRTVSQVRHN